jgi:hypothetical protein
VSAFITANPADTNYKMSNPSWNIAMKSRLQIPLSDHTLYCYCGEKMDHLCCHPYCCKNKNICNAIRNPQHAHIKKVLINLIQNTNSEYKIETQTEPLVETYFQRIITTSTSDIQSNNNHDNNTTNEAQNRADILLRNINTGNVILVDLKITNPYSAYIKDHTEATQPANQGESIKRNSYRKKFNIDSNETAKMSFFTITTNGAPSTDAKILINKLFQNEPEETRHSQKQRFWERLSSTIQSLRSLHVQNTLTHFTVADKPHPLTPASELPSLTSRRIQSYFNHPTNFNNRLSQLSDLSLSQNFETSQPSKFTAATRISHRRTGNQRRISVSPPCDRISHQTSSFGRPLYVTQRAQPPTTAAAAASTTQQHETRNNTRSSSRSRPATRSHTASYSSSVTSPNSTN